MYHLLNKTIIDYEYDDEDVGVVVFICEDASYHYSTSEKERILDIDVFNKFPITIKKIEYEYYCGSWCFYENPNEKDAEKAQMWIEVMDHYGKSKKEPLVLKEIVRSKEIKIEKARLNRLKLDEINSLLLTIKNNSKEKEKIEKRIKELDKNGKE